MWSWTPPRSEEKCVIQIEGGEDTTNSSYVAAEVCVAPSNTESSRLVNGAVTSVSAFFSSIWQFFLE